MRDMKELCDVELKACTRLATEHEAQLLGYLKAARIQDGLLINFGSYRFQIKKFILSSRPPQLAKLAALPFAIFAFFCGQ